MFLYLIASVVLSIALIRFMLVVESKYFIKVG